MWRSCKKSYNLNKRNYRIYFLENYDLYANIHTVELKSNCLPDIHAEDEKSIKSHSILNHNTGLFTSFSVVNPHNYKAKNMIISFINYNFKLFYFCYFYSLFWFVDMKFY